MEILKRIKNVVEKLAEYKLIIAIAESCTGGYVSHMLTNFSGASRVFDRGIICYSNQSKIDLLQIEPEIIEQYGAVSEIVAEHMARNVRELSNVDIGISITGIAGPTGGTFLKPVGLVYISFSTKEKTFVNKYNFKTERILFKEKVMEEVVSLLENSLDD
jgi:nicotinamide-nucleotide amidase